MKKITILLALFLSFNLYAAKLKPYHGNIKNPVLELSDLQGKKHRLTDYRGKVVLVQFWATYCPPCRKEMPSMNKLQKKLEQAGVPFKILAVDMGETRQEVEDFVKIVKPEFTILLDEQGDFVQLWEVFAAPSNFVVDKKGKIRYTLFGGVVWDSAAMIKKITELARE